MAGISAASDGEDGADEQRRDHHVRPDDDAADRQLGLPKPSSSLLEQPAQADADEQPDEGREEAEQHRFDQHGAVDLSAEAPKER